MLKPGDTFGDYKVVRPLGQGGMGAVYLLQNAVAATAPQVPVQGCGLRSGDSRQHGLRGGVTIAGD